MIPTDFASLDDFLSNVSVKDIEEYYAETIYNISKIRIEHFKDWVENEDYVVGNKRIYKGENNYYQRQLFNCIKDIQSSNKVPPLDPEHWKIDEFYEKNKNYFISAKSIEQSINIIKQIVPHWVATYWYDCSAVCLDIVLSAIFYKATSHLNKYKIGLVSSQSAIDLSQSIDIPSWVEENPAMTYFAQNPFGMRCLALCIQYAPVGVEVYHNSPNFYD